MSDAVAVALRVTVLVVLALLGAWWFEWERTDVVYWALILAVALVLERIYARFQRHRDERRQPDHR